MRVTYADLFLAYRHAKHALHQERGNVGKLEYAVSESDLPRVLESVKSQLGKDARWFTNVPIGAIWIAQKRAIQRAQPENVVDLRNDRVTAIAGINVRLHLTPSIEFAILEIL